MPIFIAGVPKNDASRIPVLELPRMQRARASRCRNVSGGMFFKKWMFLTDLLLAIGADRLAGEVRARVDVRPEPKAGDAALMDRHHRLHDLRARVAPFVGHRMLHADDIVRIWVDCFADASAHMMLERGIELRIVTVAHDPGCKIDRRAAGHMNALWVFSHLAHAVGSAFIRHEVKV